MLDDAAIEAARADIEASLQSLAARIQVQRSELNRLGLEYMELVRARPFSTPDAHVLPGGRERGGSLCLAGWVRVEHARFCHSGALRRTPNSRQPARIARL